MERESEGDEGDTREENRRRRRKEGSFGVESKTFEIGVEEKQGKTQVVIVESKGGVSSWVRLGPMSVEVFLDSLNQCIKEEEMGKWERGWRENGRTYSLVRDENRAGYYLRLGVVDQEKRRFSIFIPKGRGERGGWTSMAEMIQSLVGNIGKKENKQEERAMVKPRMDRSFAEMVKGSKGREGKVVRVEVRGEEISENLRKLEHCLGKLGLARLEKGRILLEFEYVGEAKRALSSGNRLVGGVQLGLERWSPRCGCEEEGGSRKEAWVKILRLPISLWVPSILRKVGDECGGFVAMDPQTKKMEDLEWTRILVKTRNEVLPSMLDIVVEEACYSLSLWWEVRSEMRKVSTGSCSNGGSREEVRDGIDGQDNGAGGDGTGKRVQVEYRARASLDQEAGLYPSGPSAGRLGLKLKSPWISPSVGRHGVANVGAGLGDDPLSSKAQWGDKTVTSPLKGLKLKGVVIDEAEPGDGPSYSKPNWWAGDVASPGISGGNGLLGECLGPSQPESRRGSLERACLWA
ncbi:hypothetical protein CK203_034040 [Vitis vinifera]|uniref:DUF4283 domain-containing protein n=1 Tax=Vitis vinifera TaxID=29760 RepID=A0A438IB90_VITVI|nr:hypothetical protein CK203_034040 [Vitis vinifera]